VTALRGAPPDEGGPASALQSRWLGPVVLALPFLVMIAVLRGMTVALPIFHGSDERVYHYPTILRFSHQLPFPDLHSYRAAQTPLFHLLMAYAGQVVGYEIWRLRLLQVLISYLLALAVYALLHRRLKLSRNLALGLSLLFVLSPYVFGQSFRLGTDNLALLFSVLAIERLERFRECDRLGPFMAGCAFVALAMLTRQSTAFLPAVAALYALRPASQLSVRDRGLALLAVVASCVPVGLLFLDWHGLVPVGGDPSSCGLCVHGFGTGLSTQGLEVQTMELALVTIGLYGVILFAPVLLSRIRSEARDRDLRRLWNELRWPLVAAIGGVVLLVAFPATPGTQAAGDIWKVAAHLPAIDGTSLVFWVLVPLGGAVLWARLMRASHPWLAGIVAVCFLISAVAIRYPWQKYVDPFALLILLLTVRATDLDARWKLAGAAALAALFLAYTIDYSSHESVRQGVAGPTNASTMLMLIPGPETPTAVGPTVTPAEVLARTPMSSIPPLLSTVMYRPPRALGPPLSGPSLIVAPA
jgi:4-amino-4-deoxy-L-arabinose transferase-like glycosyltransferase